VSEQERLREASTAIARAMARIEGLEQLEREILVSGEAAATAADDGDEGRAQALGRTIDVSIRAFASFVADDPTVRQLGEPRDVLTWVIAYFRARSPALERHLEPRRLTFRRLPGRLDA
jgi:hypothetical protein